MKRAWIEFHPDAWRGLVGVHGPFSGEPPERWDPPIRPVAGRGYPRIHIEFDGFEFLFVSTVEIDHVATVLESTLVDPVTSQERWYRDLPAAVKGKHSRAKASAFLRRVAKACDEQQPEWSKLAPHDGPSRVDLRL